MDDNSVPPEALVAALDDLHAQLAEARALLAAAVDPSDREEATVVVAELEAETTRLLAEHALATRGVALSAVAPSPLSVRPAQHALRWDDGKTYACDVVRLQWDALAKRVVCAVAIVGYPDSDPDDLVALCAVGPWRGLGASPAAASPDGEKAAADGASVSQLLSADLVTGARCFAVDVRAPDGSPTRGAFVLATVERVVASSKTAVVRLQRPPSSAPAPQQQAVAPAGGGGGGDDSTLVELPFTHVRPAAFPPARGRALRRHRDNMSEAQRAAEAAEKQRRKHEQQERQRRQRSEAIASAASEWKQMRVLCGGSGPQPPPRPS
jgi:hypothetical protein